MSNKKKIYYLNFYSKDALGDYNYYSSGWTKIEYLVSILERDYDITIVSPLSLKKRGLKLPKRITINKNVNLLHFLTFNMFLIGKLDIIVRWLQVLFFLLINVKRNDTLIVYHSMFYLDAVKLFMKFKNVNVILQLEELYFSLSQQNYIFEKKETSFVKGFKKIIAVSDLLKEKFLDSDKKIIVGYGDYRPVENLHIAKDNTTCKILYAGIIDNRQAAYIAAKTVKYLPPNFIIKIAGFGSEKDVKELNNIIDSINASEGAERAEFIGFLQGKEYLKLLQSCDIGLSCHSYTKEELISADNTFPSKLITYLKNNLTVVSNDIRCVKESKLSENIIFFSNTNPQDIAETILSKFKRTENKTLIEELDQQFQKNLLNLI